MPEPTGAAVARQLLSVLREAVEGPAGEFSYFIDNQPDAGLLRALSRLSAAEASRPSTGTTIAAHWWPPRCTWGRVASCPCSYAGRFCPGFSTAWWCTCVGLPIALATARFVGRKV